MNKQPPTEINRTSIINIDRTPVIRQAIIGIEREPIIGIELKWDDVHEKLVNYIKYAAKQVSFQYYLNDSGAAEDLFQEGQICLYKCFTMYKDRSESEFAALFKTSLWRKLRDIGKSDQNKRLETVNIEDAYDLGYNEQVVEDIYQEYKLQQMAELLEHEPIALTILKEFVNPSTRTKWEASMDVARKQMMREQGKLTNAPQKITIKPIHIKRALEITKVEFKHNFQRVKEVMAKVYGLNQFGDMDEILDDCV